MRLKFGSAIVFGIAVLMSIVMVTVLSPGHASAAPATFTVTTTADSGAGSLRQAIDDANTNSNPSDMDIIAFNISGSGVHTIAPATTLPDVIEKVTINGYTQTGATTNTAIAPAPLNGTVKIEVDFSAIDYSHVGIAIQADDSVIKGLAIFSTARTDQYVRVQANNVSFIGNYGGFRADGMTRVNTTGITREHSSSIVRFNQGFTSCKIGGTTPADRNVFAALSGTTTIGTVYVEADDCTIAGNYFGLAKDGVTTFAESIASLTDPTYGSAGIQVSGSNTLIGGTSTGSRNVISGSETYQLNVTAGTGSGVQGNYIGTDYTGQVNSSIINGMGIIVAGSSDNLIGGTGVGEGNVIAGVSGTGVAVLDIEIEEYSSSIASNRNAILGNTISVVGLFNYSTFGTSNQGIDFFSEQIHTLSPLTVDLTNQGPTSNDAGDSDTGPNNYINNPVIKSAQQIGDQLTITYNLDAADSPTNLYRVEFYTNDESTIFGAGPAQEKIGVVASTANGTNKTATFTVVGDYTNKALSATTTARDSGTPSGFGATSELSKNISIGSATDFDSDGSPDSVENAGPNSGDANGDGIADRLQPTVTTYEIDRSGVYAMFITSGCSENGSVASVDVSSLSKQDTNYEYPFGLTDFTLNCARGDTVNVSKYIFADINPATYTARKFNPVTSNYREVPGSVISTQTIVGRQALKLTYSITDGGALDDDATANGIIVDPVGLASVGNGLADTGQNQWTYVAVISFLATIGASVIMLQRRARD